MESFYSVIIPNYNRVKRLHRALSSVLCQSYIKFEIIVVDDFSENYQEILNMLPRDHRVKILRHSENKGGGAARNTGIIVAKGEIIAFLDSDDTWNNNKLKEYASAYMKNKYSNILIYSKSKVIYKKHSSIVPHRSIYSEESIPEYVFVNKGLIPTPTIAVHASVAKKCLFDESLRRHQDWDFILKIYEKRVKVIFIDKVLSTIFWDSSVTCKDKGWSPELSVNFITERKNIISESVYANFLFREVIRQTAIYYSTSKSFVYLFDFIKKGYLKYITLYDIYEYASLLAKIKIKNNLKKIISYGKNINNRCRK
jgi:glycosyltransferase involved in cell wall biosynthesis